MFNLENGDIVLCDYNLSINGNTPKKVFEDTFAETIVFKHTVNEKYTHYSCWFELEKGNYIYSTVSFCDERLYIVELLPQHQSAKKETSQPYTKEIDEAQRLAFEWYSKHFSQNELLYTWGKIKYCKGADPIYSPPSVIIKYDNIASDNSAYKL